MTDFALSPSEWTQIVAPGGVDDVNIRAANGSFLTSLEVANERGAVRIVTPPVPLQGDAFARREVTAGLTVYAIAVDGPAVASVTPVEG